MAIYLATLPVPLAMLLHGVTQVASNGFRAFLLRDSFYWRGIRWYLVGAAVSLSGFAALAVSLEKAWAAIALGSLPWIAFIFNRCRRRSQGWGLDFTRPGHALVCGFFVTAAHLTAGVSGPLLDVFFVTGSLTRHEIVGTKALTQSVAHTAKIVYFTTFASQLARWDALPWVVYPTAVGVAFLGTFLGRQVLDRFSDRGFLRYSSGLVLIIGAVTLIRGIMLLSS